MPPETPPVTDCGKAMVEEEEVAARSPLPSMERNCPADPPVIVVVPMMRPEAPEPEVISLPVESHWTKKYWPATGAGGEEL